MIAQDSGYQGSEYIQRLGCNPDMGQSRMPSHEEREDDHDNLLHGGGGGGGGYGEETMALGRTPFRYISCINVFNVPSHASGSLNPIPISNQQHSPQRIEKQEKALGKGTIRLRCFTAVHTLR